MQKLMILGASILQLPAYLEAKKMGIYTIAIDYDINAIGFKYCDKSFVVSTTDTESILKIAKEERIDGIITLASDMPIRSVATVCEELKLKGLDYKTSLKATDKFAMRECLSANNIPIPSYFLVDDYDSFCRVVKKFKKDCIVKPVDNSGSRGIFLITDVQNELLIEKAYRYSKNFSRCGKILVEEYMHGDEVSVESFTINGMTTIVQITNKMTSGAPYFVEVGHSQPCKQPQKTLNDIVDVTKRAIKAIGIDNSPSHTEIKITEDGPKIVEIGARLGGGNITTHLVPLSTGVNMVANTINIALGREIDISQKWNNGSAIRFFFSNKDGTIADINYDKAILDDKDVVEVRLQKTIGDKVTKLSNGSDRFGFVIVKGRDEKSAVLKCNEVYKNIRIKIA